MNTSKYNGSRFCFCGHLARHHVFETPPGTFDPDIEDPKEVFKGCEGKPKGKGRNPEVCRCSEYLPFPLGTYRHLKTEHLYVVYGLEFDSETYRPMVQYTRVDRDPVKSRDHVEHGEKWTRPIHAVNEHGKLYGFMDADSEGRPRYQLLAPMYAVDLVNNQVHIQPPFETDLAPKDMIELQDFAQTSETADLCLQIKELTAEVEEWKRRAASHGCNTEEGDPDCG